MTEKAGCMRVPALSATARDRASAGSAATRPGRASPPPAPGRGGLGAVAPRTRRQVLVDRPVTRDRARGRTPPRSATRREIAECGSPRSPKWRARVGQACTQAGWRSPSSQRLVVDAVHAQGALLHHAARVAVLARAVGAGPGTQLAADALVLVDQHDAVLGALVAGAGRAHGDAVRRLAVQAGAREVHRHRRPCPRRARPRRCARG